MTYRRDANRAVREQREWEAWKGANHELLEAVGMPSIVLRSREDWEYLLFYGYHCEGPYPNIDYTLDEQTPEQKAAFRMLLERTLTDEQKAAGSAGWHYVHPPSWSPEAD